jgi:hypothetical protein
MDNNVDNNAMVAFAQADVPVTLDTLADALLKNVATDQKRLLRFLKTNKWVHGLDEVDVHQDDVWAVNPASFEHGWIAWGAAGVIEEAMVSIIDPMPNLIHTPPVEQCKRGVEKQFSCELQAMTGDYAGVVVTFSASNKGGTEALVQLAQVIGNRVRLQPESAIPLVRLKSTSYRHSKHGTVYKPAFEVMEWRGSVIKDDEMPF